MKGTTNGTFLLIATMLLAWVGSGCTNAGGVATTEPADNVNASPRDDGSTQSASDNDDGFFVIQWTLKIGHIRRRSVHQPVPTTSPSAPAINGK